jgi:hypothetical protein
LAAVLSVSSLPWCGILLLSFSFPALLSPSDGGRSTLAGVALGLSCLRRAGHVFSCALAIFALCYVPGFNVESMEGRIALTVVTLFAGAMAASLPNYHGDVVLEEAKRNIQIYFTEPWVKATLSVLLLLPLLPVCYSAVGSFSLQKTVVLGLIFLVGAYLLATRLSAQEDSGGNTSLRSGLCASAVGVLYGSLWYSGYSFNAASSPLMPHFCIAVAMVTIAIATPAPVPGKPASGKVSTKTRPPVVVCLPTEEHALPFAGAVPILFPHLFVYWARIARLGSSIGRINVPFGAPKPLAGQTIDPQPSRTPITARHLLADLGFISDSEELWRGGNV